MPLQCRLRFLFSRGANSVSATCNLPFNEGLTQTLVIPDHALFFCGCASTTNTHQCRNADATSVKREAVTVLDDVHNVQANIQILACYTS
jgi:hypothetical protein